ncbi:esterase TesA precursor [Clostridium acetireducens DSM 10703]|jgi:acyl-CoA thioesterase-1|uniref:Esterase TesA n=1 Tax=Clostridium acetireducens DSM 10703 TaxID=1121290 RepID=A0A1E8F0P5_9CLOT|nr:GDSL-type esterase/lipase family protein [Clostridium acetireducens]OFI06990.1 esterase TesA precursor [Clostridium acetireducens DSM 10703]
MKIICIGDSLTYGFGVNSGECWVDLLRNKLNLEIINKGINGDTTFGILKRRFEDIYNYKPSYVILMGGSNDFFLGYSIKDVVNNISTLLNELKEKSITPILALQPPILTDMAEVFWCDDSLNYKEVKNNVLKYVNWAKEYTTRNNILLINFHDKFNLIKEDIHKYYSDGLHLNSKGNKIMFTIAFESLKNSINISNRLLNKK